MNKINLLTPEQEALIPEYQAKWQPYITSTQAIDKEKAQSAVNEVYRLMGKKASKVVFCRSPYEVLQLKYQPDRSSEQASANAVELNARLRSQSSFLWLFYFKLISKAIITTVALTLWNKVKPKNPIYKLQSQLNKSANKYLSKKIDDIIPSQMTTEDMVEEGFTNATEMMANQPQANEVHEAFTQFDRQNTETKAESFSTTASNVDAQLDWLPLQNKFMRWWLKKFSLGAFMSKITTSPNTPLVDPAIQRDLLQKIPQTLFKKYSPISTTQTGIMNSIWLDYASSVLEFPLNAEKLAALQTLRQECGWIFCCDRTCYICDRPTVISLDDRNRLHAEGEPAISYQDGYSVYAHHGVILPEKYGAVHPHQWQSQWLLEEDNAELRRVLIQAIGYGKLCQELAATELDTWREYTLLRIDNSIDVEPIHLLKMTCPSTGYIHSTRVPPNLRSAQKAISWVNWDINPEEFAIET